MLFKKIIIASLVLPIVFMLSACGFMAPGMVMQSPPLSAKQIQANQKIIPTFIPITPSLLKAMPDNNSFYQYYIGPRDVLSIAVWNHPELNYPVGQAFTDAGPLAGPSQTPTGFLVGPTGTIFFPLIGEVYVAGKTVNQVRNVIASRLKKYVRNPQVEVRVVGFRNKKVYVTGEVANPGLQPINDIPLSLTDSLTLAGGMKQDSADPSRIYVIRGNPMRPKVYWLDASSTDMLLLGEQFRLDNHDVVFVSTADLTRWNRAMSQIWPTISSVWMTYTMIHSVN